MKRLFKKLSVILTLVFILGFGPIGISILGTGLDLVTDGVFEVVTSGGELIANGIAWTGATGATPPNGWGVYIPAIYTIFDSGDGAPYDTSLKIEHNGVNNNPRTTQGITTVVGDLYKLSWAFKAGDSDQGDMKAGTTPAGTEYLNIVLSDATWTTHVRYFVATTTTTYITLQASGIVTGKFQLFDTVSLKPVTFVFWICGDGCSPGVDGSGNLTDKVSWDGSQAAASTVTQSGILWPGATNTFVYTITRNAGTLTPLCGATSGTARNSANTYTEQIVCSGSDLGFEADAAFIGTLDTVTVGKY